VKTPRTDQREENRGHRGEVKADRPTDPTFAIPASAGLQSIGSGPVADAP
jgi:hypothetical protein